MSQTDRAPRPNHEAIPPEELPAASPVPHGRVDHQRNVGLIWTGVLLLLLVIAVVCRAWL
jgi:hypothetical protein